MEASRCAAADLFLHALSRTGHEVSKMFLKRFHEKSDCILISGAYNKSIGSSI